LNIDALLRWIKRYRTQLIAVCIWVVLLLCVQQYMRVNDLTFASLSNQLSTLLRETGFGPLIYIGIYLLRPLILFPASLLTILGGSVFGLWPGFLIVLVAGTVSSITPYAVGRWFSATQQTPASSSNGTVQRFADLLKRTPFQTTLTMRLLYLPYDLVSILAGSLRIPLVTFLAATGLGNIAGTLSYVGIGASIQGDLSSGTLSLDPATILISIIILIVSLVVSRMLRRAQQRNPVQTESAV
jgi:uncharacterized membrane protein YdjX (TVP38/TMEM64 family)